MKKLVLALAVSLLMSACSSGTTIADSPANVTNRYQGSFQSNTGTERGAVTLDLVDDNAGAVTGNIIFQPNGASCLRDNAVTGTTTGFNVALSVPQEASEFTRTTTETLETSTETTTAGGVTSTAVVSTVVLSTTVSTSNSGTVGTTTSRQEQTRSAPVDVGGSSVVTITTLLTNVVTTTTGLTSTLTIQLTSSNEGNTLAGTYTSTSGICSNQTGSGTMTLSR